MLRAAFRKWLDAQFTPEERARLQALPTRQNEYGYDPFGFSREDSQVAILIARFLYEKYFRTVAHGVEGLPTGRAMFVSNHSGQLPFDGLNIAAAVLFESQHPRMVRSMIERFVPTLPYVSYILSRWGQVLGTPDNCRRLLADEEAILVFPEGVAGISKPFSKRYQLQRFGLGFMRLALETRTPIVPVAVIGAEEQAPSINFKPLAKLVGVPALPLMPFPPFLPIVPLPSRYHIYFGEPRLFEGDPDDDDEDIEKLVKQVRMSIESMLRIGLKQRTSIFW